MERNDKRVGCFLGFDSFENYFAKEYLRHFSEPTIKNIYLNSCNSEKFANKIYGSKQIHLLFEHSVSHKGKNSDKLALECSFNFYSTMMKNHSVVEGFDSAKNAFEASMSPEKNDYALAMVLM